MSSSRKHQTYLGAYLSPIASASSLSEYCTEPDPGESPSSGA